MLLAHEAFKISLVEMCSLKRLVGAGSSGASGEESNCRVDV